MMPPSGVEVRRDARPRWTRCGACATVCYMAASSSITSRKRAAKRPARPAVVKSRAAAALPTTPAAPPKPPVARARAGAADASGNVHPVMVGVRELRQNLSVYLDRVKQGVAMQVTEHGRVVALLMPLPASASRYDILLAQGLITPATRSIRSLPAPRPLPPGARPTTEILDELREERL